MMRQEEPDKSNEEFAAGMQRVSDDSACLQHTLLSLSWAGLQTTVKVSTIHTFMVTSGSESQNWVRRQISTGYGGCPFTSLR